MRNRNLFDDVNNLMRFDFSSYQGGLFWTIEDVLTVVIILMGFGYLLTGVFTSSIVHIIIALLCTFSIYVFSKLLVIGFGPLVLTYIHKEDKEQPVYKLPFDMAIDKRVVIFILLDLVCKTGLFISLYIFI